MNILKEEKLENIFKDIDIIGDFEVNRRKSINKLFF